MEFRNRFRRRAFLKGTVSAAGGLAGALVFGPGLLKGDAAMGAQSSLDGLGGVALAPGVAQFIGDTYFVHKSEFPDPNEGVAVLKLYQSGIQYLRDGRLDEAVMTMEKAVGGAKDSRHAYAGLGRASLERFRALGEKADLNRALDSLVAATRMAVANGRVRHTELLRQAIIESADYATADSVFGEILKAPVKQYLSHLDYALVLSSAGRSTEADTQFRAAHSNRPTGNMNAAVAYAEWLLDQARPADVLSLLSPRGLSEGEDIPWVSFLRGYAYEVLGQPDNAPPEYAKYADVSRSLPVPVKYRRAGSSAQSGLIFEDEVVRASVTCNSVITDLAKLVWGEARGESLGDQRAVAWTVRTRVIKGSVPCCLVVSNGASNFNQKYCDVIYQPNQFNVGNTYDPDQGNTALAVYYGTFPDPVANWCPAGTKSGTACGGSCSQQNTSAGNLQSARWFAAIAATSSCPYPYTPFGTCACSAGAPCPEGPPDDDGSKHCYFKRVNNDSCCGGCSC